MLGANASYHPSTNFAICRKEGKDERKKKKKRKKSFIWKAICLRLA